MGELLYALQWAPGLRAWLAHLPAWALLPMWALALSSYGAAQLDRKLRRPRYVPRHATRRPGLGGRADASPARLGAPSPVGMKLDRGGRADGCGRPRPGAAWLYADPLPEVRAA